MALKEKQTPLMANNNATYKTVEGVTYFKLKSEFDGDYTKHCGLLGEEIDENFYFLRGYDIESITVDENRNLIINRVDKDYAPLIVNIGEELGQPSFKFNKETGTITVTYPDGTTSTMEGFLVEGKDIRIATDSTFNGNGTMYNPLRLSPVETTGTFAPADEYFDLTETNGGLSAMPEGKGKGYRVVTREKIDNFGCLYPYSAVEKIQKELTDTRSQWRVPTKQDWDELLNAFECPENRNHTDLSCKWLGEIAGRAMKSYDFWENYKTSPIETPTYGEDKAGLTFYPLGITPDRNAILNDKDNDAEGFGKITGFWANTLNDEGNAYVKVFGYNSGKVDQDTYGDGARMSIRLVKDFAYDNFNEIETILGFPYPTKMVYGPYKDSEYVKIWTSINLYSDAENLGGIRSEEWSAVTDSDRGVKIIYFINEWDGTEWHKKPMENGDSVVILERIVSPSFEYYMKKYNINTNKYEYIQLTTEQGEDASNNGFTFVKLNVLPNVNKNTPEYVVIETEGEIAKYHEWRIIDGELIDTADALKTEFEKEITEIKQDIFELSATTKELITFCGWTIDTINEFSAATEEHIAKLNERIDKETEERIDGDKKLLEALQKESEIRENVDKQLHDAIVAEGEQRDKADKELLKALQDEVTLRESVDSQLRDAIVAEGEQRDKSDKEILENLKKEVEIRENVDKQLHDAIVAEGEQRDKADKELLKALQDEASIRESLDTQLRKAINDEATIRKNVDDQLLNAIRNEGVIRKNNDFVPGTYVLNGESSSEMVIPTYSEEVADIKIKVSDDFFDFGPILKTE